MNTVLLTTETTHHRYFAWQLAEQYRLKAVLLETGHRTAPFDTFHPFEEKRDEYERDVLLSGCAVHFSDLAETRRVLSLNSPEGVRGLRDLGADVMLVFGTGKLAPTVFERVGLTCLNLHGGNPEQYRGLDTHLWAIYHRDFENLVTTLHHVDAQLDTGEIVFQSQIKLNKGLELFQMRAANTKLCVEMSALALASLQSSGQVPARQQVSRGRYYSFMPSVLKEDCLRKFERHVSRL